VTRLTGKRALLEQLVADGVRYVFGNPDTTEQGFIDVLQEYPQIEFMLALHEGVAVGMADAYARATRGTPVRFVASRSPSSCGSPYFCGSPPCSGNHNFEAMRPLDSGHSPK
jgi:glyoxylate carboligase